MKAKSKNEMKEIAGSDEVMNKAIKYMEEFLNDEEIQDVYDKITDVEYYAKKEGKTEGQIEGERNGILRTAKKMLQDNLSIDNIMKYTGLSKNEIENLR